MYRDTMRTDRPLRGARGGHRSHAAPHDSHHEHGRGHGRMRHGDVRAALLLALREGPAHGYELGQRLERATAGAWRPSPGSIYPTLQTLSDEDLVTSEERDGKRIYTLTRRGVKELEARDERGDPAPWLAAAEGKSGELRDAVVGLKMAAKQVATVGSPEQRTRAVAIVVEARRQIYDLLAKG